MNELWSKYWQFVVFALFAVAANIPALWKWWRRRAAQDWPLTQGTIESVDVPDGTTKVFGLTFTSSSNRAVKARIIYSYSLGGDTFRGRYEREFGRDDEAWEFLRELEGKPVEVHYNRMRPEESALSEESLATALAARPPAPASPEPKPDVPSWLRAILLPLAVLSLLGFVLSVWIHLAAIMGHAPDTVFWALHIGIFVVFVPAVFVAQKRVGYAGRKDLWKVIFQGSPTWMLYLLYALFGYVFINFFWCMTQLPAQHHTGTTPGEWRLFSGHWMVFYYAAFAVHYTAAAQPANAPVDHFGIPTPEAKHCANGHVIGKWDSHCSICGGPRAY